MADNVAISEGSGKTIATDDVSGVQYQRIKMDVGGDGASVPLVLTGNSGIPVDVVHAPVVVVNNPTAANLKVDASGAAVPVTDNSGSLTVDAPVGTPVAVRLSDGSSFIATLPVQGTVTANQGTPNTNSNGHPVKITDGTDTVGIKTVGSDKCIPVSVMATVGAGGSDDLDALGEVQAIAGVYAETADDPSDGQVAAVRITQERALHVNLRAAAGTELGSSGAPIRTDPVGTTKQPVNLFDSGGTAFSEANPLPVQVSVAARTRVTKTATLSASQTATAIWTPASGKKVIITKVILAITVAGTLTLFGGTNVEANLVFDGTQATGNRELNFGDFAWIATAANDILRWTTGTGTVGVITVHGYEE